MNTTDMRTYFSGWSRVLLAVFIGAFLIRGIYIFTLKDGFYFPDSSDYTTAAMHLLERGEFGDSYQRPPVYPVFLAGIYTLFGQSILAVRLIQVAIGACLAVIIANIAKRIGGARVGIIAALLWSLYPLGVFIAGLVYPESVATILLASAVWYLVTTAGRGLEARHVLLSGVLFGLAALTKPVVLGTIAALSLWMIYGGRQKWHILLPVFLLGVALPLTPWTIRNYHVYGHLVAVEPRLVRHLPMVDKAQKHVQPDKRAGKIQSILHKPGKFAAHFIKEFGHFWELYPSRVQMIRASFRQRMQKKDARIIASETVLVSKRTRIVSTLSTVPMFSFALLGVAALWGHKEQRRNLSLLLLVIFSFAFGYAVFVAKTRYRIPIEPYILILSAFGLHQTGAFFTKRKKPREHNHEATVSVG